jgi:hypothetical protein
MAEKDDLLWAMSLECDVAKHLFEKLPREDWEATLAYRPTPGQRSTLELLRFLSYCATGAATGCIEGGWDTWKRLAQRAEGMSAEEFPAAMDRQKGELAVLLGPLSDDDLASRTAKNPLGMEMSLGRTLLDLAVRWLVGYRMQLFLYARALGADVWTPDCWYGVTMERPQPK